MHRWFGLIFACWAAVIMMTGCEASDEKARPSQPSVKLHRRVAVTNYPLWCLVSSLCATPGGPVQEVIYVGPDSESDPHTWMPAMEQIRDLQQVDLIVGNGPGATFANWMNKVTFDESKLCNTTDALKLDDFVVVKDFQLVHSHGPEGEHSHSWVVPQCWLSPRVARKQAQHCHASLVAVYGQSVPLDNGFADLQKRFDELEAKVEKIRDSRSGVVVASSTPEVQYLTRELGWSNRYLHWTEARDAARAAEELSAMRKRVSAGGGKAESGEDIFFWSGKPIHALKPFCDSQWPAQVTIDLIAAPAGQRPESNGYFERMEENLMQLNPAPESNATE